jgi:hypothetical protein
MSESSGPSEREKWEAELRLRQRELDIKAAEQVTSAKDVEARIAEQRRARWQNPLFLAVLAAALAAAGNGVVALINGNAQRQSEADKSRAELAVEETKSESARILEMLKTADPDKAASNLEFLLKSGLIQNEKRREDIAKFLAGRHPGQGPALPVNIASPSPGMPSVAEASLAEGCRVKKDKLASEMPELVKRAPIFFCRDICWRRR